MEKTKQYRKCEHVTVTIISCLNFTLESSIDIKMLSTVVGYRQIIKYI